MIVVEPITSAQDGRTQTIPLAMFTLQRSRRGQARAGVTYRHHHLHKLLVVNLPVAIHISFADHLVHLLVRKLLAQVRHDVAELHRRPTADMRQISRSAAP
eukprot:scaffold3289_cov362-Prasinococcus_capsulatus_cf.AAC.2